MVVSRRAVVRRLCSASSVYVSAWCWLCILGIEQSEHICPIISTLIHHTCEVVMFVPVRPCRRPLGSLIQDFDDQRYLSVLSTPRRLAADFRRAYSVYYSKGPACVSRSSESPEQDRQRKQARDLSTMYVSRTIAPRYGSS
jgi:hypothetical protein